MNTKKAIVCDLDGTLAESKSLLSPEMADVICRLLPKYFFAVVSGGAFSQFEKQFVSQIHCPPEYLQNLSFFPTMGGTCYVFDKENNTWKMVYEEKLTPDERKEIIKSIEEAISESGIDLSEPFGEIIEDRGTQVTFSGRGQLAPVEVKEKWDPDQSKRRIIVDILKNKIPLFEVRIGGATSIDVTRKGIDKAYAIGKIKELLKITDQDIIFIGDALYTDGNDSAVKKTGVDYIQQSGPDQTLELLRSYL